jgi:hypothetical protein
MVPLWLLRQYTATNQDATSPKNAIIITHKGETHEICTFFVALPTFETFPLDFCDIARIFVG